jgi:uncharacterized repeat protein (TIGR03803 family)
MNRFLAKCRFFWIATLFAVFATYLIAQASGAGPSSGVIRDSEGNLYGTTGAGGAHGYGTLFKLSPTGSETVLYSFKGGTDGSGPVGVIEDSAGNFYGTTAKGGTYNDGTVFEFSATGSETVLHSFHGGTDDGDLPNGGLVQDSEGNLYGTTYEGGIDDEGTVFKVSATGSETVLHSFKKGDNDGIAPEAGVIRDSKGNLYGTTYGGGAHGYGAVFKVSPTGTETVLYSFKGGTDGVAPYAGVIRDSAGNLYGTTRYGGAKGYGAVFKLSPTGPETMLHSFETITDGVYPIAGVIRDSEGNLYGTTPYGGSKVQGNVFKLSPSGSETVLFSFSGKDGETPEASLIRDSEGNLYGTTLQGGVGAGNVFKLSPTDVETVLFSFE